MSCRPVNYIMTSGFWFGFAAGVIVTLLAAKVLGWLVF
jgi:hypothetical protein